MAKPLNPNAAGQSTEPLQFTYRWQDVALYALGVGAGQSELPFVYEGWRDEGKAGGPLVLPTYAVIPTFEACKALFDVVGGDFGGVVHGGQLIRLHKPFASEGTLTTVGTVKNVGDLRRMAQVIFATETRDEAGESMRLSLRWARRSCICSMAVSEERRLPRAFACARPSVRPTGKSSTPPRGIKRCSTA